MTLAAGQTVYNEGNAPCSGIGMTWSKDDLDAAVTPVATILFDDRGKADIDDILTSLAQTEFQQEEIHRILSNSNKIEDWRVGEAIAEAYLTCNRNCCFPWPSGRDKRKAGSSLPGADLVGFRVDSQGNCLVFGEVKMSSEARYPPRVMRGQTGLEQQLEDLKNNTSKRHQLLIYLGHRSKGAAWENRFQEATRRYLNSKLFDVQLFGFLVRDVEPCSNDVRMCIKNLAYNCPKGMNIELIALYLPEGTIKGIGNNIFKGRTGMIP